MNSIPVNSVQIQGGYFDYDNIRSNKFDMRAFAHALGNINRFNGHSDIPFSVLQHSIFCHDVAEENEELPINKLHILIHDIHEALYVDIPRPLKRFLKESYGFDWNSITEEFDRWVFDNLNIDAPDLDQCALIKYYDNYSLINEKRYFFLDDMEWGWGIEIPDDPRIVNYLEFKDEIGINAFMDRLKTCKRQLNLL